MVSDCSASSIKGALRQIWAVIRPANVLKDVVCNLAWRIEPSRDVIRDIDFECVFNRQHEFYEIETHEELPAAT
ncbi:MAG: hypothetical protein AB1762_15330 [Gemmatimonadota bacterium]